MIKDSTLQVGLAADHAGFEEKEKLKDYLAESGFLVKDFGAKQLEPNDDYPDIVLPLALAIGKGEIKKGIAICGSGVGVSIAANKIKGVYAALISDTYSAHQGVEHDAMNLLCMGERVIGSMLMRELVFAFLEADFKHELRFTRRLDKLLEIERNQFK